VSVSEWREVRIGDIGDVVTGKTPSSKNPEYFGDEIPFVTPTDYKNYHKNIYSSERYLSQAGKEVLGNKLLPINSVIVTCIGSDMGKVAINKVECITNQQINSIILKRDLADSDFIYYTLISMQEYLKMLARGGTTMPIVNKSTFEEIKLLLPPFPEQKAIAATLSALDDMIELNNQINKTLEEMAQAIFKSWFVDFEPFKNGEFEESELGLIPKGWRVAALDEIATYLNGLAMQKYPPSKNERGLPVLKIKELRQGFTDGNSDICSESIDNSYIINDGDIIFSWSGSLLVDIWCGGRCGLNQHLFKVTSASYNKWFYYMWTRYHLERFIAIAKDKATTMGHIQRKHLSEAKVLIPEPNTLAFMDSVMQPIIDLVIANKVENKTLSTIRDTLLPKLMSGEIRVPVEEVV